ncbi:MAG TPA: hypothetical protein VMK13_13055 [Streptosporangiaceae bacterium]|nr:hypothetical protein [Streptosporangiaceae bacterium]
MAMARFASGWADHQRVIWRWLVAASWKPCSVAGTLLPGRQGKTGQPASA